MSRAHALLGLAVVVAIVLGAWMLFDPADELSAGRVQAPIDDGTGHVSADASAEHDPRAPAALAVALDAEPADEPDSAAPSAVSSALPPTGSIVGRLVNIQGDPIAGEPVDLLAGYDPWAAERPRDAIHDVVDRAVSDADGRFALGARPGTAHALFAGGNERPRKRVSPVAAGDVLEVELGRARWMSGSVVERDTGLAVPFARVGAHSRNDQLFTAADEDGRFSIGPLHDDLVLLTGFAVGYDVVISESVAPGWGPVLLELPPGHELTGLIVDAETEQPVSGASVTLRLLTDSRPAEGPAPLDGRQVVEDYVALSDDDGRYLFTGIPSRAYRVLVEAQGYRPSTSDRYLGRSPDFSEDLVIGVVAAHDLSALVLRDEQPVPGASLVLLGDEQVLATTKTDEQGRGVLPSADWDGMGKLTLEARDEAGGFARRRIDTASLHEQSRLSLSDPFARDVLVQDLGGPLAGAQVLAASARSLPTIVVTDTQGRARLTHRLADPDVDTVWLQARHGQWLSLAQAVEVPGLDVHELVVLDITDGAWFEGFVHDSFGLPLAGATVAVKGGRFTTSAPDGHFSLGPAPLDDATGSTTLVAQAAGYRRREWNDQRPTSDLLLTLQPVMHWRGRASASATGIALERFKARLQIERGGAVALRWEDAEGRFQRTGAPGEFSVELPEPGRYRLAVLADDHITAETAATDFDGLNEPPFAELLLSRAAMLSVTVADGGGRPVPGYQVWLVPFDIAQEPQPPEGLSARGLRRQLTDLSGNTRFNLGSGGALRLASGPGAWIDGGAFSVSPGEDVERHVRVPALGGMDLELRDDLDQPLPGLWVELRSSGESAVHTIRRQGRVKDAMPLIEVRDLPEGDYALSVDHEAWQRATRTVSVRGGRVTPVRVVLSPQADEASDDG